jgi:tetratricopeptide (TPR) repeat protein
LENHTIKPDNIKRKKNFPDNPLITYQKAILALSEKDTISANNFFATYLSLSKEDASAEEFVTIGPAQFYAEAGNLDKAEKHLRSKYLSEPENPYRIYDLAWFLIDKDRGIQEGLDLIDKALSITPNLSWALLDGKGWGLYKQGKYDEALQTLQECWNSRVYYQHGVCLHLEAAKKAVARLENN